MVYVATSLTPNIGEIGTKMPQVSDKIYNPPPKEILNKNDEIKNQVVASGDSVSTLYTVAAKTTLYINTVWVDANVLVGSGDFIASVRTPQGTLASVRVKTSATETIQGKCMSLSFPTPLLVFAGQSVTLESFGTGFLAGGITGWTQQNAI